MPVYMLPAVFILLLILAGLALFALGWLINVLDIIAQRRALSRRRQLRAAAAMFGLFLFLAGMLNCGVFALVACVIGGDAMNGHIKNGRYYVRDKRRVTEVSRTVWMYSYYHARSIWITHPLCVLGALVMTSLSPRRTPRWTMPQSDDWSNEDADQDEADTARRPGMDRWHGDDQKEEERHAGNMGKLTLNALQQFDDQVLGDPKRLVEIVDPANAKHHSCQTRQTAAYLLGERRAVEAVYVLSKALADPPIPLVALRPAEYLHTVPDALVKIGGPAVPAMIEHLEKSDNHLLRHAALDVLQRVLGGKPHMLELFDKLIACADDAQKRQRLERARQLVREECYST